MENQTMKLKHKPGWLLVCSLLLAGNASAFYNPSTGRWLNRDPIAESGGLNVYGFVKNAAIEHLDPTGNQCVVDVTAYPLGGSSACDPEKPPGSPMDIENKDKDAGPIATCTQEHEEQHVQDRQACCDAYRRAYRAAPEGEKRWAIQKQYADFSKRNLNWLECRAFTKGMECASRLYFAHHCDVLCECGCHLLRKFLIGSRDLKEKHCSRYSEEFPIGVYGDPNEQPTCPFK